MRLTVRIRGVAVLLLILLIGAGGSAAWASSQGSRPETRRSLQTGPTPIPLQLPTATPTAGPPSETPTRTPTSEGRPYVGAISDNANVRSGAGLEFDPPIGQIDPGTTFTVLGKQNEWYMIDYPGSPNGVAWVHYSVVNLYGDETLIQEIAPENVPTIDPALYAVQQTAAAITATPGALASLTAQALITPTGVFTAQPGQYVTPLPGQSLPTYTYPPASPTPMVIPRTNPPPTANTGLPPILPILALGALGLMGLLVSFLRRL
jgi:hypothetical protein